MTQLNGNNLQQNDERLSSLKIIFKKSYNTEEQKVKTLQIMGSSY